MNLQANTASEDILSAASIIELEASRVIIILKVDLVIFTLEHT